MKEDWYIPKKYLGAIRITFQNYLLGRPDEDTQLCTDVLKCFTVAERAFLRNVFVPCKCPLGEWVDQCAEKAGIPGGYGWLVLRICEARFAREKGWF